MESRRFFCRRFNINDGDEQERWSDYERRRTSGACYVECVEMYKWIFRNADFNSGYLLLAFHVGSGRRAGVGVGARREISPRILVSIPRAEKRELVRCLLIVF